MNGTIKKSELMKRFDICGHTIRNYVKMGVLPKPKSIAGEMCFNRKRVFNLAGMIEEPNEPFVSIRVAMDILDVTYNYFKYHNIPFYYFNHIGRPYFLKSELEKISECRSQGVEYDYRKYQNGRVVNFKTKIHKTDTKKIVQYDINGNKIAIFDSARQVQEELGVDKSLVFSSCKYKRTTLLCNSMFRYYDDTVGLSEREAKEKLFLYRGRRKECSAINKMGYKGKLRIKQMDWNEKVIKVWDSYESMKLGGFNIRPTIGKVIISRGHKWAYITKEENEQYERKRNKKSRRT